MTAETMKRPFSLTSQETTPGALAACAIGTRPKVASTYAPAGGNVSQNSSWHGRTQRCVDEVDDYAVEQREQQHQRDVDARGQVLGCREQVDKSEEGPAG